MYESKKKYYYGTGRRKSSVARVRVYENGTGSIIINGRDISRNSRILIVSSTVRSVNVLSFSI